MESADLTVLNLDSGDALDWSQDHYRDQLVAGYSKVTPNFGLRAYAKDFSKLPHAPATRAPATAKNKIHSHRLAARAAVRPLTNTCLGF